MGTVQEPSALRDTGIAPAPPNASTLLPLPSNTISNFAG
jgi:hypothetical protein